MQALHAEEKVVSFLPSFLPSFRRGWEPSPLYYRRVIGNAYLTNTHHEVRVVDRDRGNQTGKHNRKRANVNG